MYAIGADGVDFWGENPNAKPGSQVPRGAAEIEVVQGEGGVNGVDGVDGVNADSRDVDPPVGSAPRGRCSGCAGSDARWRGRSKTIPRGAEPTSRLTSYSRLAIDTTCTRPFCIYWDSTI